MSKPAPHPGDHVAHRSLDDPDSGAALDGRVQETFGDDESQLVVVEQSDGSRVAFDSRELQTLHTVPGLDRGPVILHPRHLWRLICRPFRRASS